MSHIRGVINKWLLGGCLEPDKQYTVADSTLGAITLDHFFQFVYIKKCQKLIFVLVYSVLRVTSD